MLSKVDTEASMLQSKGDKYEIANMSSDECVSAESLLSRAITTHELCIRMGLMGTSTLTLSFNVSSGKPATADLNCWQAEATRSPACLQVPALSTSSNAQICREVKSGIELH